MVHPLLAVLSLSFVLLRAQAPLLPEATVRLPPGADAAQPQPLPLLVVLGGVADDAIAAIAEAGFVVVHAPGAPAPERIAALLADLRQRFRVDQVGMHLAGGGEAAPLALRVAATKGHELQTVSIWDCTALPAGLPLARLRDRRVRLLAAAHDLREPLMAAGIDARQCSARAEPEALASHFANLHAERTLRGVAGEVARTLDDFHDAAARGDEERYFAILPDDAVFLGTDASERWTGAEFRTFALPYFERGPAWTYVPLRRFVTVGDAGTVAWFDEVLDNEAYGACRGSGVLERRDERWVLRQYNLTIPVPNELAREFVGRIRAAAEGR